MDIELYADSIKNWILVSGLRLLLILFLAVMFIWIAGWMVRRFKRIIVSRNPSTEFEKRVKTLSSVIRYTVNTVIFVATFIMVIREFGIDVRPILAAAGVVGLAVGFGAQNLVQDIIGGFFILLEDQIRVGDVVDVAGKSGVVERINLRLVVLRDLSGNVHYIRMGKIDTVTNMTKDFSRYVFDIGVAYRENVDEVIDAIKAVDENMRTDPDFSELILEPIEILGLDRFADSAVVVRARTKTLPIEQWRVGREFNRRLKKKFDELGIEIPFPHLTLYMGQDKQGDSAPVNVRLEGGK